MNNAIYFSEVSVLQFNIYEITSSYILIYLLECGKSKITRVWFVCEMVMVVKRVTIVKDSW